MRPIHDPHVRPTRRETPPPLETPTGDLIPAFLDDIPVPSAEEEAEVQWGPAGWLLPCSTWGLVWVLDCPSRCVYHIDPFPLAVTAPCGPVPKECLVQRTLPFGLCFLGTHIKGTLEPCVFVHVLGWAVRADLSQAPSGVPTLCRGCALQMALSDRSRTTNSHAAACRPATACCG